MNLKGNLTSKGLQGSIGKSRMQGILGTNPAAIPITVDNALSLSSTNPVQNRVITAAITNRLWSDEVKDALLQIVEKVAFIDEHGQDYYDALYDALYPPTNLDSIGAVFDSSATIYDIDTLDTLKQYLTVTAYYTDGTSETVTTYTLSGSMDAGTQTITVAYGGKTTTFTVTVVEWLTSISAVFTQGSATIYDIDTLDTLKQYLTVTAYYTDGTSETVTDYTLSGDLAYEGGIVDLLGGVTWTDGIAYDDNGNQLDRPTLSCSDFIPVTSSTIYTYSKPSSGTDGYGMGLYLYDANKGWVGRETSAGTLSGTEYIKTYSPASNVSYVRLMSYVDAKSGAEFTYDATPTSWTSTINVSYGGKTATFNVSVTHSDNLLFHVADRAFDGTVGDGIATGVNIQASNSSFTILAILTTSGTMTGTGTKFMLFSSRATNPNIQFTEYSSNAAHCNFRYMAQYSDNAFDMRSAGIYKIAVVHTAGSNSATCYMKANNGSVSTKTVSSSPFTTDPDAEVYFGSRGDSYWYLNGTLTLGEIYSKAFSSAEIDAFMSGG